MEIAIWQILILVFACVVLGYGIRSFIDSGVCSTTKIVYKDNPEHKQADDFIHDICCMLSPPPRDVYASIPALKKEVMVLLKYREMFKRYEEEGLIMTAKHRDEFKELKEKKLRKKRKQALNRIADYPCPKFGTACKAECCPQFIWNSYAYAPERAYLPYCNEYVREIKMKDEC